MPQKAVSYNSIKLLSEKNVKKYVLPSYNLENSYIKQIKFKNTDKQRAVYKIEHEQNSFCLKKVFYSSCDLLFIYSAVEWWYRNEINVPRILSTSSGGRFVSYHDMLFILTPWIEGRKCNYDNKSDFLKSGTNLANMHYNSKNFVSIAGSSMRNNYKVLYNSINSHVNNLLKYSNLAFYHKDEFSKLYLQHFNEALQLGQISCNAALTINSKNLSKSLCHLDYVNKNIIFDNSDNIWVIDFDNTKMDYCAHDISYCLRRILKRNSTNWNLELTINWLCLYNKINPLTLDDYKYIFVYLSFPQNYWKFSRNYFNSINKSKNNNDYFKLLTKSTLHLNNQLEFSKELKNYIENKFNTNLY